MLKRLNNEELKQQLPAETVFIPTFPYLWERISPEITKTTIELKIANHLKKSVGDLTTVLKPLWGEQVNTKTIANARALFFIYAQRTNIARTLSESIELRKQYQKSKMNLRAQFIGWFAEQLRINQSISESDDISTLGLCKETQQAVLTQEKMTIAQLLILDPMAFYRLPGMD